MNYTHQNELLSQALGKIIALCYEEDIIIDIITYDECFTYTTHRDKNKEIEEETTVIYQFDSDINKQIRSQDSAIKKNNLIMQWFTGNRFIKNPFVCEDCIYNNKMLVSFKINELPEVFCLHTSYIEDEINIIKF